VTGEPPFDVGASNVTVTAPVMKSGGVICDVAGDAAPIRGGAGADTTGPNGAEMALAEPAELVAVTVKYSC
jgi:hypothetical protein